MDASSLAGLPGGTRHKVAGHVAKAKVSRVTPILGSSVAMWVSISEGDDSFTGADNLPGASPKLRLEDLRSLKVQHLVVKAFDSSGNVIARWIVILKALLELLRIGQHGAVVRIDVVVGDARGPPASTTHLRQLASSIDWAAIQALKESQASRVLLLLHTNIDPYADGSNGSERIPLVFNLSSSDNFTTQAEQALSARAKRVLGRFGDNPQNAMVPGTAGSHVQAYKEISDCRGECARMEVGRANYSIARALKNVPASEMTLVDGINCILLWVGKEVQSLDKTVRHYAEQI